MERYLIKKKGFKGIYNSIIYGNYLKALDQSFDRKVKSIPANISDEQIMYGFVKFEDL